MISTGSIVTTGVYVCGEYKPMYKGVVVNVSTDGTVCAVDIGSIHGARKWLVYEATSQLRLYEQGDSI